MLDLNIFFMKTPEREGGYKNSKTKIKIQIYYSLIQNSLKKINMQSRNHIFYNVIICYKKVFLHLIDFCH